MIPLLTGDDDDEHDKNFEQNGFFADFSFDPQACVGATLGVSVESPGQDKVL